MHRSLLEVLCCPGCHGGLEVVEPVAGGGGEELVEGALGCTGCGRRFGIEDGVGILGDREDLHQVADWREQPFTQEHLRGQIRNGPELYRHLAHHRGVVDAAADVEGSIVDVATGPGSSFLGALVPKLSERTRVVVSDACASLVHALKAAWSHEESKAPLDFLAFDGNHMPFRDASLDGLTSALGFQSVRQDRRPERRQAEGLQWDHPYREARRVLKPGGCLFEVACRFHVPGSKTAVYLEERGAFRGLEARMEKLWEELRFEVVRSIRSETRRGKAHPKDGFPLDEADEWFDVAYVLRKR